MSKIVHNNKPKQSSSILKLITNNTQAGFGRLQIYLKKKNSFISLRETLKLSVSDFHSFHEKKQEEKISLLLLSLSISGTSIHRHRVRTVSIFRHPCRDRVEIVSDFFLFECILVCPVRVRWVSVLDTCMTPIWRGIDCVRAS